MKDGVVESLTALREPLVPSYLFAIFWAINMAPARLHDPTSESELIGGDY
jgi:hypothetical protein